MDEVEAARALEAIGRARDALAQRATWSLRRHAAVGLVMGAMIMGYALPAPWPIIVAAGCMAATAVIVMRDRRRDGFFVSGYRPGRTRWLALAMVIAAWIALFAAIVLKARFGLVWAPVVIGLAMALLVTLGSVAWERVYRQELQGTSHDD
ncbi:MULTISPECIES: hypothetical protein [unclassified Sphingomonas]|uniref:hypothetical protein n=1 Tax=unclassified Sphingomonas TaxID=196159 RepID=UPI00226A8237|nr:MULTISPECIES: hypothetical protein [unclassified Sphingomonas]